MLAHKKYGHLARFFMLVLGDEIACLTARLHSLLSGLAHDHVGQVRALGLGVPQVNLIVHLSLEE